MAHYLGGELFGRHNSVMARIAVDQPPYRSHSRLTFILFPSVAMTLKHLNLPHGNPGRTAPHYRPFIWSRSYAIGVDGPTGKDTYVFTCLELREALAWR